MVVSLSILGHVHIHLHSTNREYFLEPLEVNHLILLILFPVFSFVSLGRSSSLYCYLIPARTVFV